MKKAQCDQQPQMSVTAGQRVGKLITREAELGPSPLHLHEYGVHRRIQVRESGNQIGNGQAPGAISVYGCAEPYQSLRRLAFGLRAVTGWRRLDGA